MAMSYISINFSPLVKTQFAVYTTTIQMNELKEYWGRFFPEQIAPISPFYTAHNNSTAMSDIPYCAGIEVWCSRVSKAIEIREKICIYADYDADAVTATATMYWGLVWLGVLPENLSYYAPDRFKESYGINTAALDILAAKNTLIITVDCGISAVSQVVHLNAIGGCDILITDHHQIQEVLPDALAIINPQLHILATNDPRYTSYIEKVKQNPYFEDIQHSNTLLSKNTVGVGVAWFCVVWLAYYLKKDARVLNKLLPLVAIGTIADCQSVVDSQNRLLVQTGLQILNAQTHHLLGLDQIIIQTGLQASLQAGYRINSIDLGFTLGPLLNAPGRIAHAHEAIAALVCNVPEKVDELVSLIITRNQDRKAMVKDILAEVESQATGQFSANKPSLWIEGDWNKGIIGLVASRLCNQFSLPTIVVACDPAKPELLAASLRAPEGYDLATALGNCSEYLSAFGGHLGAAGCTVKTEYKSKFMIALEQQFALQKSAVTPKTNTIASDLPEFLHPIIQKKNVILLSPAQFSPQHIRDVWKMDPFGQDFPAPLFLIECPLPQISRFGSEQQYFRVSIAGVSFSSFTPYALGKSPEKIWILAKPSINCFNGTVKYEAIIEQFWI